MRAHALRFSAAGLFALALLTGCGGGNTGGGTGTGAGGETATTPSTTSPSASTSSEGSEQSGGEVVKTAQTDLGTILVDEDGRTLYLYTKDSPGKSVCEGDCLVAWPPVGKATAGEGVDASMLGTITRSDGATQASYGDWPLYYYAADTKAGDTTGQGVGGVWWVIGTDGKAIGMGAPASSMPASSMSY
ncbi:hypothetical protein [Georgenia sp. SYP-B2076]|uniref:COG4315 family predicted lipoprotein n=1 Tax=Georgenia sp. SYP-B2076 TaxID=2495881 RepID=UPI000F8C7C41|nr:hypothetical protein [Georgenia sp. SYP-B2076]